MTQQILVISFSPLDRDPRVRRQIASLRKAGYQVTAAGLTDPGMEQVEFWTVSAHPEALVDKVFAALKLKCGFYNAYYQSLGPVRVFIEQWQKRGKPTFDLIVANDIEALPVALEVANGAPVFVDAHEYSPAEWGDVFWRFFFSGFKDWQCRTYLPEASAMSTVCQGIADLYKSEYGTESFVIYNAPAYREVSPSSVSSECIQLVHHGGALRSRGLETMVDMMRLLDDRFQFHFYLVASAPAQVSYLNELKSSASSMGDRVIFHDPVHSDKITEEINRYDIGVYPLKPNSVNNALALPNKFFEFVQARLAIVVGPSQEMVRLLKEHDLGVVSKDFTAEAMAQELSNLTDENIWQFKLNSDIAAKGLCYEAKEPIFLETVRRLVNC